MKISHLLVHTFFFRLLGAFDTPFTITDLGRKLEGIATENKTFIDSHQQKQAEHSARLLAIEQNLTSRMGGGPGDGFSDGVDLGGRIISSEGFKSVQMGARVSGQIHIGQFHKTNLINATGQNQPLVPDYRVTTISSPAPQRTACGSNAGWIGCGNPRPVQHPSADKSVRANIPQSKKFPSWV